MSETNGPEFPILDFGTIGEPLDTLIQAFANKISREWPSRWSGDYAAQYLLEATVRANYNTYKSILFLCADTRVGGRRIEYSLSAGPLNRTILDSVFTLIFAFEDLPARAEWYMKAGWRELQQEYERHLNRYGSDPDWSDWLEDSARYVERTRLEFRISEKEAADLKSIKRWPIPGQMKNHGPTSAERRNYLSYLNDWFYKELSAESHMSLPGLMKRSTALMPDPARTGVPWWLEKQRSDNVNAAITLILVLLSEIELEIRYDLGERLKYVWGILNGFYGTTSELYSLRYEDRL